MRGRLYRKQKGYTIIEVLVAMTIGLFLMGGVAQLFSGMSASVRLQDQVAFLQENGRLAIELISKDIRKADYWGCSAKGNVGSVLDTTHADYDPNIHGVAAFSNGLAGSDNTGNFGSDTITLQGTVGSGDIKIQTHNIQSARIAVSGADVGRLVKDQVVLLSNCESADMFQITNQPTTNNNNVVHNTGRGSPGNHASYSSGSGNCTNCFSRSYENSGAMILIPYSTAFYLDNGASGLPALFMRNSTNCPAGCELIEGVENMQFLYGEDTSVAGTSNEQLTADRYVTAAGVASMQNVVSVKISLLIRTEQQSLGVDQTLEYNGVQMSYSDGFLRKAFTATVSLRNRIKYNN